MIDWKARGLKEEDWNFRRITQEQAEACWQNEAMREKSGNGDDAFYVNGRGGPRPAFCNLPGEERTHLLKATQKTSGILIWQPSKSNQPYVGKYCFEINESCPKTKILADFKRWLNKQGLGKKSGRGTDHRSWLRELAVYRLSKSGLTRTKATAMIQKTWPEALYSQRSFTSPHWARMKKQSEERLKAFETDYMYFIPTMKWAKRIELET